MRASFSLPFTKLFQHPATEKAKESARSDPQRQATEYFTPAGIEAGSLLAGSGKPAEVAYHALASAFDTGGMVKFVYVQHEGVVYYIGAPAREFASAPPGESTTELAWVLPGFSPEESVAVITRSTFDQFAGIVRKGREMSVYTGSLDDVTKFIESTAPGIQPLQTPPEGSEEISGLPRWTGFDQSKTKETQKIGAFVITTLLGWAMLMSAVWVGSGYVSGKSISRISNLRERADAAIQEAALVLSSATKNKSNEMVLEEFDRLATLAVRADVKGKLLRFSAADGRILFWQVEVPDYVPPKAYEGLSVERVEHVDGKLVLSKGIIK